MSDSQDKNSNIPKETQDDVVFEETPEIEAGDDPLEDIDAAKGKLADLRKKLKICEAEKMDYLSGWQRAKADLVNANKRHDEERKRFVAMGEENVIAELFAALDGFDMAMANKEAWEKVDPAWRTGVEYIRTQLLSSLSQFKVEVVRPLGEQFDPAKHHSIESIPTDDASKENSIVEVIQAGYVREGNVLRPAIVKVTHVEAK